MTSGQFLARQKLSERRLSGSWGFPTSPGRPEQLLGTPFRGGGTCPTSFGERSFHPARKIEQPDHLSSPVVAAFIYSPAATGSFGCTPWLWQGEQEVGSRGYSAVALKGLSHKAKGLLGVGL